MTCNVVYLLFIKKFRLYRPNGAQFSRFKIQFPISWGGLQGRHGIGRLGTGRLQIEVRHVLLSLIAQILGMPPLLHEKEKLYGVNIFSEIFSVSENSFVFATDTFSTPGQTPLNLCRKLSHRPFELFSPVRK